MTDLPFVLPLRSEFRAIENAITGETHDGYFIHDATGRFVARCESPADAQDLVRIVNESRAQPMGREELREALAEPLAAIHKMFDATSEQSP